MCYIVIMNYEQELIEPHKQREGICNGHSMYVAIDGEILDITKNSTNDQ